MNCLSRIIILLITALLSVLECPMASGEDVLLPHSADFAGFGRKLEPDKLLTSGGVKVTPGSDVTVEPEFGVSHVVQQRDMRSGYEDITHKVHVQAGGKVKLSDNFYLGFATKLPVYNYGLTEGRSPGGAVTTAAQTRHEYEILHLSPNNITWTGELGLRLGQRLDLNLYYDQNQLKGPSPAGSNSQEEVFGTRFIYRFK